MINNVAIIGLGALGIMYADHFTEKIGKENVRIIVDEKRKKRYEETGIYANGKKCVFNFVTDFKDGESADLVIFAVKANSLDSAIEAAEKQIGPKTILLSVLNGIVSEERLASKYGDENLVYCVAQGMDAVREDNALRFSQMGELRIGVESPDKNAILSELTTFFDRTDFPYTVESDIKHRIWKKFMLNVGVNQVVMVTEGNYGTVQKEGPERELMIAAMEEVIAVANAEGIALTEQDLNDNLALIAPLASENMPSMRQDGLAKRPSELDLFAGTVLEIAGKHHLEVPTNDFLYHKIKAIETSY